MGMYSMLGMGAWSLTNAVQNATKNVQTIGGSILALLGIGLVIWGGINLALWLFTVEKQGSQRTWWKPLIMIVIGGAFFTSQLTLIMQIANGGETTIRELGDGIILMLPLLS